ncbi:MAG TPA: Stk1 family PASTA domain-containing Ser/Thr kinase [Symbiobacteriaceae bacterium]|jgi:serine/threonine-protein kinase
MMLGKMLAGRYRVGDRIGGGGMALVYRAEDLQLVRDVAVKVLRTQFGSDEEFVRRFRREAQNAASLSHPNIVQIYDVGHEDDQHYIVMELVEGKTLKELIQRQGPLPIAEAARIAIEILSALTHAHTHRIVHRDIKPHNILIARDGRVKVTDFGIARATTTDTVTHTGSIMGSAHYFSPEQANGQPTGEKSDIYSMGIVLYEMVTGKVPFQGDSPITVALKHLREQPAPPALLNPEVPVELQNIIVRALEKDPEDRFASADAMRQELEQFAAAHAAGQTHMYSGDFPTMDLRAMKTRKARRLIDDEEETRPAGKPKRSFAWIWVALVALVVVGGVGSGVWAIIGFLDVPTVSVPQIEGLSLDKAQKSLSDVKLYGFGKDYQFSDTVPFGSVIKSDPRPGTPVKVGRTIDLTLSKGAESKQVPDVVGKSEMDARNLLESAHFKVDDVKSAYSSQPEGTVIEMVPGALTILNSGSIVKLTVSKGPLRVPKIIGKSRTDAQKMLEAAGLILGNIQMQPDPTRTKDTVLSSDPPQDAAVNPGTAVNLVVAQNVAGAKTFAKEIIVPGTTGQWYEVAVKLVDQMGVSANESTVLPPARHQGGEKIPVTGVFFGDNSYLKVIVDGRNAAQIEVP